MQETSYDLISEEHHVVRVCKPSWIGDNGLPITEAFALRDNEQSLSVNWLEYFELPKKEALDSLFRLLHPETLKFSKSYQFLIFQVSSVKRLKASIQVYKSPVLTPGKENPAHASIEDTELATSDLAPQAFAALWTRIAESIACIPSELEPAYRA